MCYEKGLFILLYHLHYSCSPCSQESKAAGIHLQTLSKAFALCNSALRMSLMSSSMMSCARIKTVILGAHELSRHALFCK